MADVKSLEQAAEALDPSALAEFMHWFAEVDAAPSALRSSVAVSASS